jgi:hypothetical protein
MLSRKRQERASFRNSDGFLSEHMSRTTDSLYTTQTTREGGIKSESVLDHLRAPQIAYVRQNRYVDCQITKSRVAHLVSCVRLGGQELLILAPIVTQIFKFVRFIFRCSCVCHELW